MSSLGFGLHTSRSKGWIGLLPRPDMWKCRHLLVSGMGFFAGHVDPKDRNFTGPGLLFRVFDRRTRLISNAAGQPAGTGEETNSLRPNNSMDRTVCQKPRMHPANH